MYQHSDYLKQAKDFLEKTNTSFSIKKAEVQTPPSWTKDGKHGYKYKVTLKNAKGTYAFDFWDSIANRQEGKRPDAYSVLACLDIYHGSLDDFVLEFGYNDSDLKISEVLRIYESVQDQTIQLEKLFTESQLKKLMEIA